jgi:hypothetical protein
MRKILALLMKHWEYLMLFGIGLMALIVGLTIMEFQTIGVGDRDLRLWNKRVELSAGEDSTLRMELGKLRENEVIIIYTHENERAKIFKIPDDSLQFWADSLYNGK